MTVLLADGMRWAEKKSVEEGATFEGLMENAGCGAADFLLRQKVLHKTALILCGKGNNGGDGLVIARVLAKKGWRVQIVYLLGQKLSELAQLNRDRLRGLGAEEYDADDLDEAEREFLCQYAGMIIDGCFGTGFSGELPEKCRLWMAAANRSDAVRAALDIPSGMNCDTGFFGEDTFRADCTVTFAARKPAHLLKGSAALCGEVHCVDIGISEEIQKAAPYAIQFLDGETARKCLPERRTDSNKGDYGKLLAVGGCASMTGAILMASMAAMRCGVGLLKAAIPAPIVPIFAGRLPEVIYCPVNPSPAGTLPASAAEQLLAETQWGTAVLLGCGMSVCEDTVSLTEALLKSGRPLVLDADGLNCAAQRPEMLKEAFAPVVLTPHLMEFSRLSGRSIPEIRANRFVIASEFAKEYGVTLILKDATTVIAAPDGRLWMNGNGNSGMAKAGSGDVLAGMTASFLAQGALPEEAAQAAVFLHAEAGDAAAADLTPYCMNATDTIAHLPDAFRKWMK